MSLKLLIADDETLIREGLASLDWEHYGLNVVAACKNGEEAFEMVKRHHPDIILSDIRMPKRDGLWLAENVTAVFPEIKIVFITSYSDFEYAQKAIELGIAEYILKPIEDEPLFQTVCKLRDEILEEQHQKVEIAKFKSTVAESKHFLKSWFLNRFSNNEKKFEFFALHPENSYYAAIVVRFDSDAMSEVELDAFLKFEKIVYQLKDNKLKIIPFYDGNLFTFFFEFSKSKELLAMESALYTVSNQIKDYLDEYTDENYTIGIGFIQPGLTYINDCYETALSALNYSSYLGAKQIIYIKDFEPKNPASMQPTYNPELNTAYLNAIKAGNEFDVEDIIDSIFNQSPLPPLDDLKRTVLELIIGISKAIAEAGEDPKILFNDTDVWSVVNKCEDHDALYQLIKGVSVVVSSRLSDMRNNKNAAVVAKVKQIVEDNYAETASLDNIATQIYLSPCYLSVIFSKETNMTFKDYLIQTRIRKAKELLENTNMKIYEVAKKVGYNDARYFSDLFRRITGKTPSQFRNE